MHTYDGLVFRALHGLCDAIRRAGGSLEVRPGIADGLVVERVDEHLSGAVNAAYHALWREEDAVCGLASVGFL